MVMAWAILPIRFGVFAGPNFTAAFHCQYVPTCMIQGWTYIYDIADVPHHVLLRPTRIHLRTINRRNTPYMDHSGLLTQVECLRNSGFSITARICSSHASFRCRTIARRLSPSSNVMGSAIARRSIWSGCMLSTIACTTPKACDSQQCLTHAVRTGAAPPGTYCTALWRSAGPR